MNDNLITTILSEIYDVVWDRDIPSPTIPEYVDHHKACVDIMNAILDRMQPFAGKSNAEIAKMLLDQ